MRNGVKQINPKKKNSLRSFFSKNSSSSIVRDILDTDEDVVINQFKVYKSYLSRFKNEIVKQGTDIINYKRKVVA